MFFDSKQALNPFIDISHIYVYTNNTLTEQSHEASSYNLQHISILAIYHRILSNIRRPTLHCDLNELCKIRFTKENE